MLRPFLTGCAAPLVGSVGHRVGGYAAAVKPAPFQLHTPSTVAEAVELLTALPGIRGVRGDRVDQDSVDQDSVDQDSVDVKLLAGGQSLVPLMNFRLARPDHVIDLGRIDELDAIEVGPDGTITLGAMTTHRRLGNDPSVAIAVPLMTEAVGHIGHGHIRNRGTLGGSLAHADPAAELPAVMVALDASIVAIGPEGRRSIPADEFFAGWFTTALADDELLTAVEIPARTPARGGAVWWGFTELARRPGDFATVLIAAIVERDERGVVVDARIVAGGVGATPVRCVEAEQALVGSTEGDLPAVATNVATTARGEVDPSDDVHASATYRAELVEVLVGRTLTDLRPVATPADPRRTGAAMVPSSTALDGQVVVNGEPRSLDGTPDRRLLADWLRDDLGLTGTHLGCEHGVCGACTVLLDGTPVRSCLLFARQSAGRSVATIEALGTPSDLHPVQEAFRDEHGLQCGFCTPGMVLATVDLLDRIPHPTDDEIRHELSGNICRCTGYVKIVSAVRAAAERRPHTT